MNIFETIQYIITTALSTTARFIPNLLGGLVILVIGLILAQIVRRGLSSIFTFLKLQDLFKSTNLFEDTSTVKLWEDVIVEIAAWGTVILFFVPAAEAWGLTKVSDVLNSLLLYLPNVLIAVIIAFVGAILANLAHNVVVNSVQSLGQTSSKTFGMMAKYTILFFTGLVVLNQLGVAQDLIRILFTGIIAMLALAGGLAFGLGGQQHARELLEDVKKHLK